MKRDLVNTLSQMPSVVRFRQRILDDLKQGRSALVIMNDHEYADAIWQTCHAALWREDCDIFEVNTATANVEEHPSEILSQQIGVGGPASKSARSLDALLSGSLPEIIAVRGLDDVTAKARQCWLEFMGRWSGVMQSRVSSGQRPAALWAIVKLERDDNLPASEVWLNVHWWWAVPTALEIRQLCRSEDGLGSASLSPLSAWREALIPEIAGNDLLLIDTLWDVIQEDKQSIYDRLLSCASGRGWSQRQLQSWKVPDYLRRRRNNTRSFAHELAREERILWMSGIVSQIPERGLQVSSVALAVLGAWDSLDHRLWRGQAALLLPMIDELRLSICERLTRKYGPNWPWQWWEPAAAEEKDDVRANPLSTQLGHLENLIRNCTDLREEKGQLTAISTARHIRNQLAHYTPVTYTAYANLVSFLS
jgi:hypothetical protein